MSLSQDPSQTVKWQQMAELLGQYPHLLQSNLVQQNKKIIIYRWLSENLLVFLLQYVGLTFSTLSIHSSPLWIASGVSCAFVFLRGVSVLPGIWLGSVLAYSMAKANLGQSVVCATLLMLQAYLLLVICYRFIAPTLIFYRRLEWVKFVLCSLVLTAISSIALTLCCYSSIPGDDSFMQTAMQWWFANFNGLVIFSCAIIAWDAYFSQVDLLKQQNSFLMMFIYGLLLVLGFVFVLASASSLAAVGILMLLIIIGVRYGWCGEVAALFLLGFQFVFIAGNYMPFATVGSMLFCQLLLCISTIVGLFFVIK